MEIIFFIALLLGPCAYYGMLALERFNRWRASRERERNPPPEPIVFRGEGHLTQTKSVLDCDWRPAGPMTVHKQ